MTPKERERLERDAEFAGLILLLLMLGKRRGDPRKATFSNGTFYLDGKKVSVKQIRNYLTKIETRFGMRFARYADALNDKRIDVAEFRRRLGEGIASAHQLAGALATGSFADAVDSETVRERIAAQAAYADRFADQLDDDEAGSERRIRSRAARYATAATITFGILQQETNAALGVFTEAMRIQRASESCAGCEDAADEWMPIDEIPEIGSMECGDNCRCYIEYR